MKLKNNIVLKETNRHLSSNMVKIIILMNVIISVISAIKAFPSDGITLYYFDEILYHHYWFGMNFLVLACLFVSMRVMVDSQKNYFLISRFSSKKEFIKKVMLINVITITVVIITVYLTNFLAFNIFSSTSLAIRNLSNFEFHDLVYVSNLTYLAFFLIRSLFLLLIINMFNIILIYILKKPKVFLINIALIFTLFGLETKYNFRNPISKLGLNMFDLRHYFRYPAHLTFNLEVISSILIIVILGILLYLSINVVKYVKNIEQ